jgi:23S rRNA pseudouridine1911/1915/1917 synthase
MPDIENHYDDKDELYEHYRIVADKGQGLLRIDKFLMSRLEDVSRNKIQQAALNGNIRVNNNPVKPNYRVKPGDIITVVMPDPPRVIDVKPENISVNVVYEDQYLLVVDKAPGIVVHPGYGNYTGTLLNALAWHIQQQTGKTDEEAVPYLVHRIDKDTSGLLLIAKDENTQTKLSDQFQKHSIDRKYNALVWGAPIPENGTITGHIGRSLKNRKVMAVFPDGTYGKHAVTHYTTIAKFGYVTLVECQLETGRTHQIRAHFKYIGHPLFNDGTYGGNQILKGTTFTKYKQFVENCFKIFPRQALHAKSLGFKHPVTSEFISLTSELPENFSELLHKWSIYANTKGLI